MSVLPWIVFLAFALPLGWIDAREHRLPNRLVLLAVPCAALAMSATAALTGNWHSMLHAVLGSLVTFAALLALALASRGALGMGDVKLGLFTGLYLGWLGWWAVFWGTVLGFVLGAGWAAVLLIGGRANRGTPIPLGPFLLGAVAIVGLIDASPWWSR